MLFLLVPARHAPRPLRHSPAGRPPLAMAFPRPGLGLGPVGFALPPPQRCPGLLPSSSVHHLFKNQRSFPTPNWGWSEFNGLSIEHLSHSGRAVGAALGIGGWKDKRAPLGMNPMCSRQREQQMFTLSRPLALLRGARACRSAGVGIYIPRLLACSKTNHAPAGHPRHRPTTPQPTTHHPPPTTHHPTPPFPSPHQGICRRPVTLPSASRPSTAAPPTRGPRRTTPGLPSALSSSTRLQGIAPPGVTLPSPPDSSRPTPSSLPSCHATVWRPAHLAHPPFYCRSEPTQAHGPKSKRALWRRTPLLSSRNSTSWSTRQPPTDHPSILLQRPPAFTSLLRPSLHLSLPLSPSLSLSLSPSLSPSLSFLLLVLRSSFVLSFDSVFVERT